MSWWQKKVLRYGLKYVLSRSGLLDDTVIDPDNLDIAFGKQNVIELKDVGLNIKRIAQLAQLPPCLRLETARVLSLRLTIPADIFQSSIVVEVDGVELLIRLDDSPEKTPTQAPSRPTSRSTATARAPLHRKMNRRSHSPPPYDPGGSTDVEEEVRIPTAQEMAQSFLLNEPSHERRELEAALAGSVKGMEESIMSESSEGGDTGTGTGIGVPAFLASFIQGVVNRLRLEVRNVHIRVETTLSDDLNDALPVTLRLKIDGAKLDRMDTLETDLLPNVERKRLVQLSGIAVDLLSPSAMSREATDQASQPPLFRSASTSRTLGSPEQSIESHRGHTTQSQAMANAHAYTLPGGQKAHEDTRAQPHKSSNSHFHDFNDSIATSDSDHFAEAVNHEGHSDFEIQPGDDNISWGSRQRMASPPADDLWKSMTSDDDLPASLILESPSLGPNAQSSRSHSLSEVKQRTPDSSHERPIRGPGSWPRLNDSTPRHRPQQSPGSWPTLDQIHRSAIEPLDQILTPATHNTNQHRPAPEDAGTDGNEPQTPPEPDDEVDSGMLSSQAFSQEEEQSIYMSAIADSPEMTIPGGWAPDTQSEISDEPAAGPTNDNAQQQDLRDHSLSIDGRASGYATPRPQTPEHLRAAQASADLEVDVRELVRIDTLSISIPSSQEGTANTDEQVEPLHSQSLARSAYGTRDMPGTFSAYSEMSSSRMRGAQSTYGQTESSYLPALAQSGSKFTSNVRVQFGTVRTQIDISTGRTLLALSSKIMRSFDERSPDKSKTQTAPNTAEYSQPTYSIQIECLRMSLKENIHNQSLASVEFSHGLIDVITEHIRLRNNADASLRIGDIAVRLGGQDLLTFNRDNASSTIPQVLPIDSPVIAVDVVRNRFLANKRPITDVNLHTASVNLCIDLAAIDETFNSFGGLSGMLELGNSMLSESGASSPTAAKAAKGVRFAGDSETTESLNPELKLNGRINAIAVTLRGAPCLIVLQTSTMKLIYREVGTIATIEHISLKGPIARDDNEVAPIMADLATVRVEFHLQPQDKDLERLLSLLTPSKDKYDSDDDILIDTLLRQRRKGSLLRAAIGDVKLKVDDWKSLTALAALSDDLAKLSAVTKYLPEDDRPGLLTLIRVKSGEARVPVNERFGVLRCTLRDLHVAHVGLPALLALAIGGVTANRLDDLDLVHALVPSAEVEGLPMVMARMLGDEEEPTIKIKLFNLGVEYSVPILLDLTDTADELDTDDLVAGIVQSVADLAMTARSPKLERLPSDLSASPTRRTNIKLLVHDSAIGLKPQKLASKAYFVLIDAHMSTLVPPEDTFSVTLELRKASLFLTDQIISHSTGNTPHGFSTTSHSNTSQRLASTLSKQGCVSMGSIMSAKVFARVHAGELNAKVVEVKVSNELCLLETCADSTQTLIATLTALAPPTPPNKQPKYNIEPMTIEDMMASFTGDPFAKPDLPPETLFDAKADQEDEPDMLMGVSTLSMTNDLLEASGMTDSVYLPMGGDVDDHAETESTIGEEYPMTVESLLEEEDPFEMPSSPSDINLGDAALMRDLARQSKPALREESIDLGLYEIEDLGFDALGSGQQALGTQHRFNGPYAGRPKAKQRQLELPFKFHLRDFHVIWHIYDGYDWQRTRDGIVEAVEQVELKAEERRARWRQSINDREEDESVIGDFLFNSIYIGVPADHDAQELRRQINRNIDEQISETESIPVSGMSRPTVYSASGQPRRQRQRRRLKLGRSKNHKIAFELKGVSADVLVFPPDSGEVVSSIDLRVKDFEIFDKVPTSTWRKFLTHMDNDPDTREMAKPMFHIQLDNVKTLESHSASEIVLKVTVLPLRLHVDQDALDFITRFFEFKDESTMSTEPAGERPFLQRVEIDTVDMCLDYKPKNVDYVGLRSGRTTEFMNFITLDASMIRLKHAIVYGLRGFETLHQTLNDVWMPDIQRNQLPGILAGLAPVRSLVNLGSGMRDVVAIPVREYKKDGRIVRSIQKGAFHFGKTTASELARLGAKVALGTQTMLTNAEHFLSPAELASSSSTRPSSARSTSWHDVASDEDEPEQRAISAYANQPLGVFAGLRSARRYLEHDLLTAKDALIAVRGEFLESRGPGGVASAVARHAPTVLLRPVIGATRAVGTTLLGVGNQIDRDNLRKMDDKYKPR